MTKGTKVLLALGSFFLITMICFSIGPLPRWILTLSHRKYDRLGLIDQIKAEQDLRVVLLQAVAGSLLVFGAIVTWRQATIAAQQLILAREARVTDSLAKAIEHIGATDSFATRVGGIYALDRIARKEGEERLRILEVLTEFVRQEPPHPLDKIPGDIQAALRVITSQVHDDSLLLVLDGAHLRGASLNGANLQAASLRNVNLEAATLARADLRGSHLVNANLRGADLRGADLRGADLTDAKLDNVNADSSTQWP